MRVAIDAASLLLPPTGVGLYTLHLIEQLQAKEALDLQLFALSWAKDTRRIPGGGGVELKHVRFPARFAVNAWEILGFPAVQRWLGDLDVVHGPNFWVPPVSKKRGVVTIHDMTFFLYPEMCTAQVRRYRWIVPRVLDRCHLVLTPSNTVKSQVAELLGFPEDRIVVTPEGVSGVFKNASSTAATLSRYGVESPYVIFSGTHEPRKNLPRLIRAFERLDDSNLKLVLAGPRGWGMEDLEALAARLGMEERVIFTGYLDAEVMASFVAGARAYAYPSIYEGFGLAPLEAMSAGVPVIAGKAGSLPEVLLDAPFWCDPLDVASIAEAIEASSADSDARIAAIARGREVAALYSWEKTANLTIDAYRRVASS
jgi:glycosyltransferase involved in cell wall biosynthesis